MSTDNRQDTQRLEEQEQRLKERLERIRLLEQEVLQKEKSFKNREGAKKQIVLRLAPSLWDDIAAWADEEYRSINGQIEYLLADAVRKKKNGNK